MKNKTDYKQTEIGEIPEDWDVVDLKSILIDKGYIRGPFGSALRRPELKTKGIPVYEQQHAIYGSRDFRFYIDDEKFKELKRFQVQTNDLIISCSGTLGKVSIISEDDPKGIISQALLTLRPNPLKILPDYLKYFFTSKSGFSSITSRSSGSVQVNIANRQIIEQIKLALPGVDEQQQIASVLSSLDDKIELNRRMNKTLEEMGKALFKRWFVDFEFPDENGKPYKSNGGEMVESELGLIPKGWKAVPLIKVFDFLEGPGIRNWQYADTGTRFINIRLINNGDIDIKSANYINQKDVDTKYQHFLLQEGDMVVSASGTLGKNAIVRKSHLPLLLNTSVIRFRPQDNVSYPFMYQYLQSEEFLSEQIRLSAGSVQANFGPTHLKQMSVLSPSKDILDRFNQICGAIYQEINAKMDENEQLGALRDSLLPRLMSGKLRVKN